MRSWNFPDGIWDGGEKQLLSMWAWNLSDWFSVFSLLVMLSGQVPDWIGNDFRDKLYLVHSRQVSIWQWNEIIFQLLVVQTWNVPDRLWRIPARLFEQQRQHFSIRMQSVWDRNLPKRAGYAIRSKLHSVSKWDLSIR